MPPADVESPPRAGGRHVEWQDDDWTTMDSRSVTPDSTAEHREQPQPAPAFGRLSSAAELVAEWANEEDDGDSAGPISLLARLFLALDMVGSTLLFFLGGLHNEHAFLDSSTEVGTTEHWTGLAPGLARSPFSPLLLLPLPHSNAADRCTMGTQPL